MSHTPGGEVFPIMAYTTGLFCPEFERGTFFRLQVYEKVVIPLAEKSVFSVIEKAQMGQQMHFMSVKKSRKRFGFLIYSYMRDTVK